MDGSFQHLGDLSLLDNKPIAFFCSTRCPGDVVLAAYAWAREQCDLGSTIISGFHTPLEKDVYAILARRGARLIHCPARTLPKRLNAEQQQLIAENRLLILSPFNNTRSTREISLQRNRFVASHAVNRLGYIHSESSLQNDPITSTLTPLLP